MIVSHAKKLIFFHNPKCAGMSFRETLKPFHDDKFSFWGIYGAPYFRNSIDHSHLRLWEMQALFPRILDCAETYNSVIFVRNPYRRFISALNEHFKKFQPQIDLAAMAPAQRVAIAEQFVGKMLHISRITTDWRFVHFSPQIWFLRFGHRQVPRHIVAMGDDSAFARVGLDLLGLPELEIPWINPSPVDLSAALDSPVLTKFVEQFYADDFALFLADDRLQRLARHPSSAPAAAEGSVIRIYHNPACTTSRKALGLIRASGEEPEIIEYLKTPPSRAELVNLIGGMGTTARALLRRRGAPFDALGLADPALTEDQLIDAMLAHPILIERPIVTSAKGARLCRPPERVLELLPKNPGVSQSSFGETEDSHE